jgi:hypothetical protein
MAMEKPQVTASRRAFLQSIALLTMQTSGLQHGGAVAAMLRALEGRQDRFPARESQDAISFGVGPNQQLLDLVSHYAVPKTLSSQDRLCFDVSNNRISCSINAHGLLERFAIQVGVSPVEARGTPAGAYVEKVLFRASAWPILISIGGAKPVRLDELQQPEIYLEDNLFPRYEWTLGPWKLRMLAFAPQVQAQRPRAVCTVWSVHTMGNAELPSVQIMLGEIGSMLSDGAKQNFPAKALCDQGGKWSELVSGERLTLAVNGPKSLAMLLASDSEELSNTQTEIASQSCSVWLDKTKEYRRSRYGVLSIPDGTFYAELYTRAAELSRQSLLLNTEGRFGGSFNGSDLPAASNVWMRDCFYSSLPQTYFAPDLCSAAILFFLRWGIPSRTLGDHADHFPAATGVTNSLGNSVAGIVLAGAYYASSGDKDFFLKHPEVMSRSLEILDQVLVSRREDVFLFPSIYVSDGESRGDFHTGSNIFLWRAFCSIARIIGEVYGYPEVASIWSAHANRLRDAILSNCVSIEGGHNRFVEGSMQDHTKIGGHDGEESDVTLAAFYEFCNPDDDAYINAAREAISRSNPYAIEALEGIWWYAHFKWSSATFPGWTTALASSRTEEELARHLERIRTLTDADGSFWWWPYPHDASLHPEHPLRLNSKCGWAAGVYVCFFTRQVLGLAVDAAKRTLAFRPFSPWNEFTWKSCRIGTIECDCSYSHREGEILLTIRNRMAHPMEITLQALLPENTMFQKASMVQVEGEQIREVKRYGRTALEATREVAPGIEFSLLAKYVAKTN